jgi:hypothetical protein
VPKLRISGPLPSISVHAFVACMSASLPVPYHSCDKSKIGY